MANTYTQIYIHVVFAVQARQSLIRPEMKDEIQKYMTGIVTNQGQKLIAINNMPDHFHLLIGLKPDLALSSLVRDIKAGSSGFVNKKRWVPGRFEWQEGFGAFSSCALTVVGGDSVYSESRATSRAEILRRRIPGFIGSVPGAL